MKLKDAMLRVQYDPNWQIFAKSTSPNAEAKYAQASERTYILKDQGYRYITNGEQIGDYIANYCEDVPDEYRGDFAEEAVERFLETL